MSKTEQQPTLRLEWRTAEELADNEKNWRRHPDAQTRALADVIGEVGWAGALLYNERTGKLIDGHARKKIAKKGEKVPVLIGRREGRPRVDQDRPSVRRRPCPVLDVLESPYDQRRPRLSDAQDSHDFTRRFLGRCALRRTAAVLRGDDTRPPDAAISRQRQARQTSSRSGWMGHRRCTVGAVSPISQPGRLSVSCARTVAEVKSGLAGRRMSAGAFPLGDEMVSLVEGSGLFEDGDTAVFDDCVAVEGRQDETARKAVVPLDPVVVPCDVRHLSLLSLSSRTGPASPGGRRERSRRGGSRHQRSQPPFCCASWAQHYLACTVTHAVVRAGAPRFRRGLPRRRDSPGLLVDSDAGIAHRRGPGHDPTTPAGGSIRRCRETNRITRGKRCREFRRPPPFVHLSRRHDVLIPNRA